MVSKPVTISIVSHAQGYMVSELLKDLKFCEEIEAIVLTINVPEPEINCPDELRDKLIIISNKYPLGFGSNHNQAFAKCKTKYFAVLNPDIRFSKNPFTKLINTLLTEKSSLIAPLVVNSAGGIEDSARYFPTPKRLLSKLLLGRDGRYQIDKYLPTNVDFIAGMFMLFNSDKYEKLNGFDEKFFMYYEDVDICARFWNEGEKVTIDPSISVIHDAQRTSNRNLRYFSWHLSSMALYFYKHFLRLPVIK